MRASRRLTAQPSQHHLGLTKVTSVALLQPSLKSNLRTYQIKLGWIRADAEHISVLYMMFTYDAEYEISFRLNKIHLRQWTDRRLCRDASQQQMVLI